MIPNGEDWRIRKALGYMSERKVLQWARTTICDRITERDIVRIARDMPKQPGVLRIGRARDAKLPPIGPREQLSCNGSLAKKIDAYIAARSKECGVHPDFYRRALGWR